MMKLFTVAIAASSLLGLAGRASADMPGKDWMPADQVIKKLTAAGYSAISEIEADDGHWEGDGIKNGVKMEFHADAKTGEILSEKPDRD